MEGIVAAVQTTLAGANTSRSFSVQVSWILYRARDQLTPPQTLLPGATGPDIAKNGESSTQANAFRKPAPNYKIRMDPSNRTLDSMLAPPDPSQIAAFTTSQVPETSRPSKRRGVDVEDDNDGLGQSENRESLWDSPPGLPQGNRMPESECAFTSIRELRKAAKKRANAGELSRADDLAADAVSQTSAISLPSTRLSA